MRTYRHFAAAFLLLFAAVGSAVSQTNDDVNATVQFNFSNPGARSLGFGGAFIGLADDATAAATNPAGLTILTRPEVSLEARGWNFEHLFISEGRAFGSPTGQGVDTIPDLRTATSSNSTAGLSFLSFVFPVGRASFAIYRREVANFEANTTHNGPLWTDTDGDPGRLREIQSSMRLKIADLGFSGALRVSDKFSIGATLSIYDFSIASATQRFGAVTGFYAPADFSPGNEANVQTQVGDETAVGVTVGALLRPSDRIAIGVVYRPGPKFDFTTTNDPGRGNLGGFDPVSNAATFDLPDVFGIGLSIRPTDSFTVAFEFDRVQYSQLAEGSIDNFFAAADPLGDDNRAAASRLFAEDASEFHVGLEYVFAQMKYPVALRGGLWNDPEHRIQYPLPSTLPGPDDGAEATSFYPIGEDQLHVSFGGGLVFGSRFQVDLAWDLSERVNTFAISSVVRF